MDSARGEIACRHLPERWPGGLAIEADLDARFPVLGLVEEEFGFASGELIARRTVARYREQLGILSSSKRKQVF